MNDINSEAETLIESGGNIPPGEYGMAFMKMLFTLLALILLFVVSVWFLRKLIRGRLQKGAGQHTIHVLEKKMISPKTMLYIVEVEGQKVMIAESQLEVRPIQGFGVKNIQSTTLGSFNEPNG